MNPNHLNLQEVLTFIEVARHESLSDAAVAMRVSTATVSRRLSRLEERLGTALLNRSTRSLTLTEVGERYLETASRGLELILSAEEEVQDVLKEPRGVLRVAAPSVFVRHQIGKIALHYARRYPEVELHILEVDEGVDMDGEKIDIAIQVLPPSKWELQGVRSSRALTRKSLGQLPIILCATPEYLKGHDPIEHPSHLEKHRCIVQGANPSARFVRFRRGDGTECEVEVSMGIFTTSVSFCRRAVLAGVGPTGLTLADCKLLLERGELVHILPEWEMENVRCIAAFVDGPRPPQRIRAFLDLCDEWFTLI